MKTVDKTEERKMYSLRSPITLMDDYKKLAIKNRRSINDEIITAMEKYLAQQEQQEHLSP